MSQCHTSELASGRGSVTTALVWKLALLESKSSSRPNGEGAMLFHNNVAGRAGLCTAATGDCYANLRVCSTSSISPETVAMG